ncbi:MAG: NAD-dependent epimerase/dehydratase family protein [Nocardioidaceae bacterium]
MRVLVLGGTRFVGRHLAAEALERGHRVTLLNRGVSAPELFPEAEHLRGDRGAGEIGALAGRRFDAVLDTSGYHPADVEATSRVLRGAVGHYTFVSSISAYTQPLRAGADESTPLLRVEGPPPAEIAGERDYGALKALCELALERALPDRLLRVRPGLIVGPFDPSERFTYWPRRIVEGGPVLAAEPSQPVQLIDARDLGSWILDCVEDGRTGVLNAVGPERPLTMEGLLAACAEAAGDGGEPVWVGDDFLLEHGVEPWEELPLWVPIAYAGLLRVNGSRAYAAGLRVRPLGETIADTLRWDRSRPPGERRERLSRDRERALLAAWHRLGQ